MYRGSTTYHVRKFPGLKLGQEVSWDEVVRFGRGKSKNESRTTTRKRGCTKWPFSGGPPGTAFFDPIFSSWLIANLKFTKFWVFISRYFSPLNSEKLRSAKMLNLGSVRNSSNLVCVRYRCENAYFCNLLKKSTFCRDTVGAYIHICMYVDIDPCTRIIFCIEMQKIDYLNIVKIVLKWRSYFNARVHVPMHIRIHVYKYTHMYTYICTYTYTYMYICTYTYTYTCTYTYIYTYTYMYTYMYICTYTYIHIHTYTYVRAHVKFFVEKFQGDPIFTYYVGKYRGI